MNASAAHASHYFLLVGMAHDVSRSGGSGPAEYPSWVRPFIIVSVIITWMGLNLASAMIGRNIVPWYVHVAVIMLVASLFRVEFGNIHIEKKDET